MSSLHKADEGTSLGFSRNTPSPPSAPSSVDDIGFSDVSSLDDEDYELVDVDASPDEVDPMSTIRISAQNRTLQDAADSTARSVSAHQPLTTSAGENKPVHQFEAGESPVAPASYAQNSMLDGERATDIQQSLASSLSNTWVLPDPTSASSSTSMRGSYFDGSNWSLQQSILDRTSAIGRSTEVDSVNDPHRIQHPNLREGNNQDSSLEESISSPTSAPENSVDAAGAHSGNSSRMYFEGSSPEVTGRVRSDQAESVARTREWLSDSTRMPSQSVSEAPMKNREPGDSAAEGASPPRWPPRSQTDRPLQIWPLVFRLASMVSLAAILSMVCFLHWPAPLQPTQLSRRTSDGTRAFAFQRIGNASTALCDTCDVALWNQNNKELTLYRGHYWTLAGPEGREARLSAQRLALVGSQSVVIAAEIGLGKAAAIIGSAISFCGPPIRQLGQAFQEQVRDEAQYWLEQLQYIWAVYVAPAIRCLAHDLREFHSELSILTRSIEREALYAASVAHTYAKVAQSAALAEVKRLSQQLEVSRYPNHASMYSQAMTLTALHHIRTASNRLGSAGRKASVKLESKRRNFKAASYQWLQAQGAIFQHAQASPDSHSNQDDSVWQWYRDTFSSLAQVTSSVLEEKVGKANLRYQQARRSANRLASGGRSTARSLLSEHSRQNSQGHGKYAEEVNARETLLADPSILRTG